MPLRRGNAVRARKSSTHISHPPPRRSQRQAGPRPETPRERAALAVVFLILNLALAFYNVGTIWAHEIDIFRSWRLVDRASFHRIQRTHWRKLPYWVFVPVFLALLGSLGLIGYHPEGSPEWGIWGSFVSQFASLLLTAALWGRWQASLSKDERGPESPHLARILRTHWIRTALINANAFVLLCWIIAQSRGGT